MRRLLVGLVASAAIIWPAGAGAVPTDVALVAKSLRSSPVYVDPSIASLVDRARLLYAVDVASRAADGAHIRLAFMGGLDFHLVSFRDDLYAALDPSMGDALIVATPQSVTIRTSTLTPEAELAIEEADDPAVGTSRAEYTAALSELVYDTGLVIHNTRPGAIPRGAGRDRNLATFSGRFPGEGLPAEQRLSLAEWLALGAALALIATGSWLRYAPGGSLRLR